MLKSMAVFKYLLQYSTRLFATLLAIIITYWSVTTGNESSVLTRIEYLLYDLRFNVMLPYTRRETSDHKIAIVDIDEASIVSEGRFPWSRHKIAKLIEKLGEAGVVVMAFDVVFSEAEDNPVSHIQSLTSKAVFPISSKA